MYGYVYKTTNNINGKKYIGQKKGEFNNSYKGSGTRLKLAIEKYGKENFKVELIKEAYTQDELNRLEKEEIEKNNAVLNNNFYNMCSGGDCWGSPALKETREKISKSTKGRPAWNKGIPNKTVKERMVKQNPMKNQETARKCIETRRKNGPHLRIKTTFIWECENCGKKEERRSTVKEKRKRFCNKSCATTFMNKTNHWSNKRK